MVKIYYISHCSNVKMSAEKGLDFLRSRRLICLLLFVGIFILSSVPVSAMTFQAAVNGAVNGVVELSPSEEYDGKAYFGSDITVNGNGARVVVTEANDYSTVAGNVKVILNNLTIDGGKNGIYLKPGASLYVDHLTVQNVTNSGISSDGAASISIIDSTFQNIDSYGINLYSTSQAELISGCSFSQVQSIPILIQQSSNVDSIFDCTIIGTGNTSGDAVSIQGGSSAEIENCDISQATAGIAVLNNSNVVIRGCNIHNNLKKDGTNTLGQGIYVLDGSSARVLDSVIENNDNAGFFCRESEIEVGRSIFHHNGWGAQDGEGIDCRKGVNPTDVGSSGVIYDSKITANYLYGIQGTSSSMVIEGCEVRNNRIGGINLMATTGQDARIRGCILDENYNASFSGGTYEATVSGDQTSAFISQSYFGFNRSTGILVKSGANANIESCWMSSNYSNNINVYLADIDVNWSYFNQSNYGIYFNTANSSSIHNSDFFDHTTKHAQAQTSNPYPDCANNWWGDAAGPPVSSTTNINYNPWLTEPVSFTCLERGYDITMGVSKQFSFIDLPVDMEMTATAAVNDQIFVAYGSHHNIFPSLPAPVLGFTPLPENIVYLWINASLESRFQTDNQIVEFYYDGTTFENPASGEILKFNDESQQWEPLAKTFIANENRILAEVSDIAGKYILYTNHNVMPEANFTVNKTFGDAPLFIQCTDLSVGSVTSWLWDFTDGHISREQNPTHIFELPGTYNIMLTVSNSAGTDTAVVAVTVDSCSEDVINLNNVGFQQIVDAYAAAVDGDIIQLQAVNFNETLIFDQDVNIILQGGNDCHYENCIGNSIINGSIIIEAGSLECSNIEIH